MESMFTIKDLISDAKTALEAGSYFSALSLTFAIIAECANIAYPDEWFDKNADTDEYLQKKFPSHYNKNGKYNCQNHDRERFQMWVDDWENDHNCDESLKSQMKEYTERINEERKTENGSLPITDGELLYQLRCSLFHNASSDIEFSNSNKISDECNSKILQENFALILDDCNLSNGVYSVDSSGEMSMRPSVNYIISHYLNLVELFVENNRDKSFPTIKVNDNRKLNPERNLCHNS